jgi:hypothetical protein
MLYPTSNELILTSTSQFTGLWRRSAVDTVVHDGIKDFPYKIEAGDLIFASFRNAHLNVSPSLSQRALS